MSSVPSANATRRAYGYASLAVEASEARTTNIKGKLRKPELDMTNDPCINTMDMNH